MASTDQQRRIARFAYVTYAVLAILAIAYVIIDLRILRFNVASHGHFLIVEVPYVLFVPLLMGFGRLHWYLNKWKDKQEKLLRYALPMSYVQALTFTYPLFAGPYGVFPFVSLSAIFLSLGLICWHLPMNEETGFVCRVTLSSPMIWKETHEFYGKLSLAFFAISICIDYSSRPFFSLLLIIPWLALPFIFACVRYRQLIRKPLATTL